MKVAPIKISREIVWYSLPSPLAPGSYEDRIRSCSYMGIYGSEKTCILAILPGGNKPL